MVSWLSDSYNVNVNAIILNYVKTKSGDELLTKTSIISEEIEQERIKKKKFQISMSDEPGKYDEPELRKHLEHYLSQNLHSSRRMRDILLPICLKRGTITRDELKEEFVNCGEASDISLAGSFLSLISSQVGMKKNDFLRQVISYEYPNNPWEKDNYQITDEYKELVKDILESLQNNSQITEKT